MVRCWVSNTPERRHEELFGLALEASALVQRAKLDPFLVERLVTSVDDVVLVAEGLGQPFDLDPLARGSSPAPGATRRCR